MMAMGGTVLHIKEYPVFKPNDYFFKHHSRDGEEKWQTFARVIREEIF
jgi:hypothetical protein